MEETIEHDFSLEGEIWKPVLDDDKCEWSKYYEVSNLGRVRRIVNQRIRKGHQSSRDGYVHYVLTHRDNLLAKSGHVLVYEAFNGKQSVIDENGNHWVIHHKNHCRHDNRLCNLDRITKRANYDEHCRAVIATKDEDLSPLQKMYRDGGRKTRAKTKESFGKKVEAVPGFKEKYEVNRDRWNQYLREKRKNDKEYRERVNERARVRMVEKKMDLLFLETFRKKANEYTKKKRRENAEFRERINKKARERRKERMDNEPEFKEKQRLKSEKWNKKEKAKRDGSPEYRAAYNAKALKWQKEHYHNDEEYRRKCLERNKARRLERIKNDPTYKERENAKAREREHMRRKNPEYVEAYNARKREYIAKNRERINQRRRELRARKKALAANPDSKP